MFKAPLLALWHLTSLAADSKENLQEKCAVVDDCPVSSWYLPCLMCLETVMCDLYDNEKRASGCLFHCESSACEIVL